MTTSPKGKAPLLGRDIYYRGYRLHISGDGHRANDTHIYSGIEFIDTCGSEDAAKAQVDEWLRADDGR
jgi:hypothetical protein